VASTPALQEAIRGCLPAQALATAFLWFLLVKESQPRFQPTVERGSGRTKLGLAWALGWREVLANS
jgi:hypothetical protein